MKESDNANSYTIDFNKKKYTFYCSDGEAHVLKIEEKLKQINESLSPQEAGHILSIYAMKIVLLLTDELVRETTFHQNNQLETEDKVRLLLDELDGVLNSE